MKVLSFDPELCVGCHICEETCSDTWFKVTDPQKSSIRIYDDDGEGLLRAAFCNQCGACIAVCPTEALYRDKNGIVRIRKKQCVGCLSCVGFCPYLVMFYHPDQVEPFKCIACGKCADECPADALAIVEVETPASPQ
jgi:carbon-monoxide dehydrogenase iron sulfur subunit